MTNENKPPMFGPSTMFNPATHEPRAGKSFCIAESDVTSLADNAVDACTIIGNCTTTIPMKFDFHDDEIGHAVVFGPSGKGMSAPLEMFQDQYQKRDGKLAVVDIGTSSSGFINEDKEA